MKVGAALLGAAAVLALSSTSANAGRLTSWYGVFEGGGTVVQDFDIQRFVTPLPVTTTSSLETNIGWAALASVGYAYDNGYRVELEGGYRHNEFDQIVDGLGVAVPADGSLGQYTLMANVLYDFPSASGVTFTLGGGVGASYARFDGSSFAQPVEDDEVSLAFQAIAGLSYQMTSWLDLVMNYRYMYVTDFEFSEVDALVPANTNHVNTDDLHTHTLSMGLRFGSHKSDVPPVVKSAPPPPPPPSAQVARQYVIYFAFNKCAITAEADAVLTEAAGASRTLGSVGISIVGHTDTVGSRNANQRLSECRAGAAKSNLVSKGIPGGMIQTAGAGEGQLLVQTPDRVKEPQNRRATVDLN
jgi:OmpA-OmpF porin, OOP family